MIRRKIETITVKDPCLAHNICKLLGNDKELHYDVDVEEVKYTDPGMKAYSEITGFQITVYQKEI